MYNILYTAQCQLYNVHDILYTVHCKLLYYYVQYHLLLEYSVFTTAPQVGLVIREHYLGAESEYH